MSRLDELTSAARGATVAWDEARERRVFSRALASKDAKTRRERTTRRALIGLSVGATFALAVVRAASMPVVTPATSSESTATYEVAPADSVAARELDIGDGGYRHD